MQHNRTRLGEHTNEQSTQDKSCINKYLKDYVSIDGKHKYSIEYFIAGRGKVSDRKASAKIEKSIQRNLGMVFQTLDSSKAHFITGRRWFETIPNT